MEMKEKILQLSATLFMRLGIKSVTMDDLASELGISKKTLYQFFDNKADLVMQLVLFLHEYDKRLIDEIVSDSENAIDELLKIGFYVANKLTCISPVTFYDMKKYHRDQWDLLQKINREHVYEMTMQNLKRGREEGLYKEGLNDDFLARLHVGQALLVLEDDIFPIEEYPRVKLMHYLLNHHVRSISTEKGMSYLRNYMKTLESELI
jgi:TetR/AcrR family transcriptional regulator, cholesterol catabolism regulator